MSQINNNNQSNDHLINRFAINDIDKNGVFTPEDITEQNNSVSRIDEILIGIAIGELNNKIIGIGSSHTYNKDTQISATPRDIITQAIKTKKERGQNVAVALEFTALFAIDLLADYNAGNIDKKAFKEQFLQRATQKWQASPRTQDYYINQIDTIISYREAGAHVQMIDLSNLYNNNGAPNINRDFMMAQQIEALAEGYDVLVDAGFKHIQNQPPFFEADPNLLQADGIRTIGSILIGKKLNYISIGVTDMHKDGKIDVQNFPFGAERERNENLSVSVDDIDYLLPGGDGRYNHPR